ncbi:histidine kinase [Actinoplanes sp. NPDC051861]|uniref:histidine kinase n=1 Tax=Actinoplanes sp. NPDC051861 TaxID=3155170 RepID=UPI0034148803
MTKPADLGMRLAVARAERWDRHRARRPRKHPDWPPGAVIAAALFHLVGTHNLAEKGGVFWTLSWPVDVLLMVGPVALFWRRRAPVPVFVIAAAASLLYATGAAPHFSYAAAPAIALFTLSRSGRTRAAAIAGALAYLTYLLVIVVLGDPLGLPAATRPSLGQALLAAAGVAGAVVLGAASKVRSEQLAELSKVRAEQARAKEEQERRQASEERLRIARELHDVLGHHLSLINVQAGVGLHLMDNRPEQAREALTAIKSASAEALREVRAVLGVLRTEGEAAPRQPALGLNRLDELTADAGFPVRTIVNGTPRELPAEVDRAAYRIVQEALTNVRRHAAPDPHTEVTIGYLPTTLHLSIRNGATPTPPASSSAPPSPPAASSAPSSPPASSSAPPCPPVTSRTSPPASPTSPPVASPLAPTVDPPSPPLADPLRAPKAASPSPNAAGTPTLPAVGSPPASAVGSPPASAVGSPPAPAVGSPPAPAVGLPPAPVDGSASSPAPNTAGAPSSRAAGSASPVAPHAVGSSSSPTSPAVGSPATAGERGSGIAGMRARAEALGGRLEAGQLAGGGFLVSAILPAVPARSAGASVGAEACWEGDG